MYARWKQTLKLWSFGFFKVPLIFWIKPKVLELNSKQAVILIKLNRRTKNHLNSMYFGALCVGADVTGGIHMMFFLEKELSKLSFVFKDFQAEFLKRPESDVIFTCQDGASIEKTISTAKQTKARENVKVNVIATTSMENEVVARFILTLSIKVRS